MDGRKKKTWNRGACMNGSALGVAGLPQEHHLPLLSLWTHLYQPIILPNDTWLSSAGSRDQHSAWPLLCTPPPSPAGDHSSIVLSLGLSTHTPLSHVGAAGPSSTGQRVGGNTFSPKTEAAVSLQRSLWAFRWKPIWWRVFMKTREGILGN